MKRLKKLFILFIILNVIIVFRDAYSKSASYITIGYIDICSPVRTKDSFYSNKIREKIEDIKGKYIIEGMVCISIYIVMDIKKERLDNLKEILKQKVELKEITKKEMELELEKKSKKIPEEVVLFEEKEDLKRYLKIYCYDTNGKKEDISNMFILKNVNISKIESKKGKNVMRITLFFKKEFLKSLKEGNYKIEIIYDSRNTKRNNIWRGIIKKCPYIDSELCFSIIKPKNKIQYLAGKLNWIYYCGIYTNIFSKKEIDEIITLGKRILTEEPGFYLCHLYLGHINYKAYKRYGDERYKKDAYNEYKKWLKIFDNLHIQGVLSDKEWKDYSYVFKIPIEKRLKELK